MLHIKHEHYQRHFVLKAKMWVETSAVFWGQKILFFVVSPYVPVAIMNSDYTEIISFDIYLKSEYGN